MREGPAGKHTKNREDTRKWRRACHKTLHTVTKACIHMSQEPAYTYISQGPPYTARELAYMTLHIIFLLKISHCLKESKRKKVKGYTLQTHLPAPILTQTHTHSTHITHRHLRNTVTHTRKQTGIHSTHTHSHLRRRRSAFAS